MELGSRMRPIRSYVLRQGRVSHAQKRAYETLLPRYGVAFHPAPIDFDTLFGRVTDRFLEIGFGMGETTASIAAAHPDRDYLGIEVHTPGVGSLLKLIEEQGLSNLRMIQHDAVEVLRCMIAPESLSGVHIFFPDPWPKARHHKRRLIQPAFVALLAERLRAGGYVHIATDWESYARQVLAVLSSEPRFTNPEEGFATCRHDRPLTKFEQRGLALGHEVWDVFFRRI